MLGKGMAQLRPYSLRDGVLAVPPAFYGAIDNAQQVGGFTHPPSPKSCLADLAKEGGGHQ